MTYAQFIEYVAIFQLVNQTQLAAVGSGFIFKAQAYVASNAATGATYNNGTAGVGATLTYGSSTWSLDGVAQASIPTSSYILIKDESTTANNGLYVKTSTTILTRASNFDNSIPDEIQAGDYVAVLNGTVWAGSIWSQVTPAPITVGTTAIVFQELGFLLAGTGLYLPAPWTLAINNTGVSGSSAGGATSVPAITYNPQGQLTAVTNTPIQITESQVTSLTADLAARLIAANNLSDLASAVTARTNLGLASAAVQPSTFFAQVANNLSDMANVVTALANLGGLPLAGGTITGAITNYTLIPTAASELIPKAYADSISAGTSSRTSCRLATTGTSLTVTYNNGTAGVGATLTNAGTQAALVIDSVTASVGDRILIKDQTGQYQNGIYVVTNVGSNSTNWIITRASDFNTVTAIGVIEGAFVVITEGTVNATDIFVETGAGPFTIGTTGIVFSPQNTAANIIAGTGLTKVGNVLSITNTAVSPASYGAANSTLTATANAQGQLTALATLAIAILSSQVTDFAQAVLTNAFGGGGGVMSISSNTTLTSLPQVILADTNSGNITIQFPDLTTIPATPGQKVTVYNTGTGTNIVAFTDHLGNQIASNLTVYQGVEITISQLSPLTVTPEYKPLLNNGNLNNVAIGGVVPAPGAFTTLSANNIVNFPNLTASQFLSLDGSNDLVSKAVNLVSSWVDANSTPIVMIPGTGYITDHGVVGVTYRTPTTCAQGSCFIVLGGSNGGWTISPQAGQNIITDNGTTTPGASGTLMYNSATGLDSVLLITTVANTTFRAIVLGGNITGIGSPNFTVNPMGALLPASVLNVLNPASFAFVNADTNQTNLSVYEFGSYTSTFTWGTATSGTITIQFWRIGRSVTVFVPSFTITNSSTQTSQQCVANTNAPARLQPAAAIIVNTTLQNPTGTVVATRNVILTTGQILFQGPLAATITGAGNLSLDQTTFSYYV